MKKEINAIIIDDEAKAIDTLKHIIQEENITGLVISDTAMDVQEGLNLVLKLKPDMVFLDIQMPGQDGFELIHELRQFKHSPAIVFTTAHDEYAIKAIRHEAFDYLLKPIAPAQLRKVIERYFSNQSQPNSLQTNHPDRSICFKGKTKDVFIRPKDVIYVKAEGNYANIIMTNKEEHLVCNYLATLEKKLSPFGFLRISRSYLVNSHFIKTIHHSSKICELKVDKEKYILNYSTKYYNNNS